MESLHTLCSELSETLCIYAWNLVLSLSQFVSFILLFYYYSHDLLHSTTSLQLNSNPINSISQLYSVDSHNSYHLITCPHQTLFILSGEIWTSLPSILNVLTDPSSLVLLLVFHSSASFQSLFLMITSCWFFSLHVSFLLFLSVLLFWSFLSQCVGFCLRNWNIPINRFFIESSFAPESIDPQFSRNLPCTEGWPVCGLALERNVHAFRRSMNLRRKWIW